MSKNKFRTYVIGDLHGAYKALDEVLTRVNFNYSEDKLIFLGDLADGWGEFHYCLDVFKKIKNFIPIIGNHDLYLIDFLRRGEPKLKWLNRGGRKTLEVIDNNPNVIDDLRWYFNLAKYYHIEDKKIFCHGGFNHKKPIIKQKYIHYAINRKMYKTARKYQKQKLNFDISYDEKNSLEIKEIFIGHSTTKKFRPVFRSNLTNLDTGAGSVGYLTIMDIHKKTYIQSQKVTKLYGEKLK